MFTVISVVWIILLSIFEILALIIASSSVAKIFITLCWALAVYIQIRLIKKNKKKKEKRKEKKEAKKAEKEEA